MRAYVRTSRRTAIGTGPLLTVLVAIVWLEVMLLYCIALGLWRLGLLAYMTLRRMRRNRVSEGGRGDG